MNKVLQQFGFFIVVSVFVFACAQEKTSNDNTMSVVKILKDSADNENENSILDSFTYKIQFTSERDGDYGGAAADIFIYNSLGNEIFKLHSPNMDINEETVVIKDFNFDGKKDVAIQNGYDGGYGSWSWDIYTQRDELMFEYHDSLSVLMHGGAMGLFDVDEKLRTLETYSKSGAAIHFTTTYTVVNDKVIKLKEEGSEPDSSGNFMIVYKEIYLNGKSTRSEKKMTLEAFENSEYY